MFLSLVLLGLCIGFIILHLRPRRPKNFPPGPPALPILGNTLQLNLQNPLEDLDKHVLLSNITDPVFFYVTA
uniref:Uncharacterized protein n=1 Tax=Acanthochromis polyacanthus TaxID=80966 RepID=A0A3Q1FGK6_9TELE